MQDGGGMQVVAIRFPSVDIAPGSTIGTATILFDVDEVRPGQSDQKVSITIFGEASANPVTLTAASYDLSNRDTTSAAEMWTPTASSTTHEDLATSDISSIMNEIVRLPGWVSGNPMVILFGHVSGRGVRWVESARDNNGIMTPALRWTTLCGSGIGSTDAVIDTMDGPPEFLPLTNLYFSPACPWDTIDNAIYSVSSACCTERTPCNPANQGVPSECTFDCNRVFAPFMTNCRDTIRALLNDGDANAGAPTQQSTMNKLDHYTQICSQFSVASMASAIYGARCVIRSEDCMDLDGDGDVNVDDLLHLLSDFGGLDEVLGRTVGVRDLLVLLADYGKATASGCANNGPNDAGYHGSVSVISLASWVDGYNTVQLMYSLSAAHANVYAMAGTPDQAMTFPAAFQVAAPFGVDIGGVPPVFFAVIAEAEIDSWLTVGPVDGTAGAAISASPGLGLGGWTADTPFTTSNGAVFWMNPDNGPSGSSICLAQVTTLLDRAGTATAVLQGRSTDGATDWSEQVQWSW